MVEGCEVEGPPESGGNWWEGTGVGSVGSATSGGAIGGGGADPTPAPSSGGAPTTSGSGSADAGSGGDDEPPPPPPSGGCQPDPNDLPCIGCLKQACCAALQVCQNDLACQCWQDCLQLGDIGVCFGQCGLPNDVEPLLDCVQSDCLLSCGW
jgi:hypothetical protein